MTDALTPRQLHRLTFMAYVAPDPAAELEAHDTAMAAWEAEQDEHERLDALVDALANSVTDDEARAWGI